MATQEAVRMSPQELHDRVSRGEHIVILDVRTADAISVHPYQIPEARWLPLASVVEQTPTLPRQAIIVSYCT
ncbi:MAG: rhodanese-like domain-containing protein [Candidatus Binatia bacterium]